MKHWLFLILILSFTAQAQTILLRGVVKERNSEKLHAAHIIALPDSIVTITDEKGNA